MDSETLEDCIKKIKEFKSQHFMFFIYKFHSSNLPVAGTRFDVYDFKQSIAGSSVTTPNTQCHDYALTHNSSMAFFFTDDIFGDRCIW